ncbi:Protein of unknown function [Propionibacterium freudenreichii]|nr:Protein of unknown function [Propionibacterium freudenreichii]
MPDTQPRRARRRTLSEILTPAPAPRRAEVRS